MSGGGGELAGYARISTHSQKDDTQRADLEAAGCIKIFTDTATGKNADRPGLDEALAYLRPGDTLVITRLSRAMRSLRHMLALTAELEQRGVGLRVLRQSIDTTTPTGRLVFHILAAIDEFQRELIVEGTLEGLAVARAKGRLTGRKRALTPAQVADARTLLRERDPSGTPTRTQREVAKGLGVSPSTLCRALQREEG